jgi:hypothetical protein
MRLTSVVVKALAMIDQYLDAAAVRPSLPANKS